MEEVLNLSFKAEGTDNGLVRNVLGIANEQGHPINDFVATAAENPDRSGAYIAQTLASVSEMCKTPSELAYAGYVVGLMLGPTAALREAGVRRN